MTVQVLEELACLGYDVVEGGLQIQYYQVNAKAISLKLLFPCCQHLN